VNPEDALADLIARCPEHGTRTETWPECRCAAARKAATTLAAHEPTPAQRLREAAAKIRKHAGDANADRPAPWEPSTAGSVISRRPGGYEYVAGFTTLKGTAVADWIALMHPGIGEPLAAWLESVAERLTATTHPEWQTTLEPHAFALADQILGKVTR